MSFDLNFLEHLPVSEKSQKIVLELSITKTDWVKWELPLVSNRHFLDPGEHLVTSPYGTISFRLGWRYQAKRERGGYSRFSQTQRIKPEKTCLLLKFYAVGGQHPHTEARADFFCPFCRNDYHRFRDLVCHLETCHDRFTFRSLIVSGLPEIHIALRPLDAEGTSRTWGFVGGASLRMAVADNFMRLVTKGDKKKSPAEHNGNSNHHSNHHSHHSHHHSHHANDSNDNNNNNNNSHNGVATIAQGGEEEEDESSYSDDGTGPIVSPREAKLERERQYFHPNTFAPVRPCELRGDNDEELDEGWILHMQERDLDDYNDLSYSEKAFMKLWNRFAHGRQILDDRFFAERCMDFAKLYGATLLAQNLRSAFVFHLLTMWEFGKISAEGLRKCMLEVDSHKTPNTGQAEVAQLRRLQQRAKKGEQRWATLLARAKGGGK